MKIVDIQNADKFIIIPMISENRISSDLIVHLEPNQVFVFGSNEAGRHGKGAAKLALSFGAVYGVSEGLRGHTYAIPTKDSAIRTLSLEKIKLYVDKFIEFAKKNPHLTFLVTEIGCGLSSKTPEEIAPLFIEAITLKNVYLPKRFWDVLISKI